MNEHNRKSDKLDEALDRALPELIQAGILEEAGPNARGEMQYRFTPEGKAIMQAKLKYAEGQKG
jgi:hypothetical protein